MAVDWIYTKRRGRRIGTVCVGFERRDLAVSLSFPVIVAWPRIWKVAR